MPTLLKITGIALGATSLLGSGIVLQIARANAQSLIHRSALVSEKTPADYGMDFEDVRLATQDGLALAAWYIPSTNGSAIVVQHGYRGARDTMLEAARLLHRHGYGVLLMDARAHGDSEGEMITFGLYEVLDVRTGLDYLLGRPEVDPDRIGALGNSQGAVTLLLAAAAYPAIQAVVADSPYAALEDEIATGVKTFTGLQPFPFAPLIRMFAEHESGFTADAVSPIRHVAQISPRPVFLLQGGLDTLVPPDTGQRLFDAAGDPKDLWFDAGVGHTTFLHDHPEEYERRVVGFFDKWLGEAGE